MTDKSDFNMPDPSEYRGTPSASPLERLRAMEAELIAKHKPKAADRAKYQDKETKKPFVRQPKAKKPRYKPQPKHGQVKNLHINIRVTPRARRFLDLMGGAQDYIEQLALIHEAQNPLLYRNLPTPKEYKKREKKPGTNETLKKPGGAEPGGI